MGGLEGHVAQLGRGLVARGVTVAAVCLPRADLEPLRAELSQSGVRVHALPSRGSSALGGVRRLSGLVQVLRSYPGCIVHMHYGGYGGGELIQLAAGLARARAVVRTEHVPPVPPFTVHGRVLVRIRDRFLASIICVAEQNRLEHIQKLHRRPDKFVVIPNGIDLTRYTPRPPDPSVLEELGFEPGTPLVGAIARLTEHRKRIDLFIDMAAEVLHSMPAARFVIVGEGDLRPALEQQVTALGIGDRVQFLGERSDVPRLLAALRVFVMPSTYEAGPLTVLEALAMGRPVVSTPVGIVPEVIDRDGCGGRLVPVGQSGALARATLELLADEAAANQLGQLGRQRVIANFSIETMVNRTLDLYRSVAQSSALSTQHST
jgi:glycosyltransferase involved in cell wall biosynthesis